MSLVAKSFLFMRNCGRRGAVSVMRYTAWRFAKAASNATRYG
jgi:hypothetical protein